VPASGKHRTPPACTPVLAQAIAAFLGGVGLVAPDRRIGVIRASARRRLPSF
jgi:hypothetical protein